MFQQWPPRDQRKLCGGPVKLMVPWCILVARELSRVQVVVVHNDPVMALLSLCVTKVSGRSLIFRLTHIGSEEYVKTKGLVGRQKHRILNWLRDIVATRCACVVTMSDEMTRFLQIERGLTNCDMKTIPSMVRANGIHSSDMEEGRLEGELPSIKKDMRSASPALAYVGNISARREVWFLFDVVRKLIQRGWNPKLVIFGVWTSTKEVECIEHSITEWGVEGYIRLCDPVRESQLPSVLSNFDLGVSPLPPTALLRTNSLVKNLEYLRAGIGVVASENPDSKEVVEESGGGYVVRHDAIEFANAIEDWMGLSTTERKRRTEWAARWVRDNRSLENATEAWESALRQANRLFNG